MFGFHGMNPNSAFFEALYNLRIWLVHHKLHVILSKLVVYYTLREDARFLRPWRISSSSAPLVVPHIFRITFLLRLAFRSSLKTYICSSWCFSGLNWAKDIITISLEESGFLIARSGLTVQGGYNLISLSFLSKWGQRELIWLWVHEELVCATSTALPIILYTCKTII